MAGTTTSDSKVKKWLGLVAKGLLAFVVVGVIAWFAVINPYLIRQEKKRFETAAVSVEKLSSSGRVSSFIHVSINAYSRVSLHW